jgi:hypothetical protein
VALMLRNPGAAEAAFRKGCADTIIKAMATAMRGDFMERDVEPQWVMRQVCSALPLCWHIAT